MDFQQLRAFREVARSGSFSAAADHLFLTQPAVSHRISQLEERLETRLLDRVGRTVQLTQSGRSLLAHAEEILGAIENAERAVRKLSGEVSGALRLSISHHIGLHRLPPILRAFSSEYPQVHLDIQFTDSEIGLEQVRVGEVELAIITLPPAIEPPLRARTVWPDPLSFFAAPGHPLSQRRRLALADLLEYDALLPSENTFTRRILGERFRDQGLKLQVSIATNYMETLKVMAAVGLGWTLLPDSMEDPSLRRLPVRFSPMERSLGYVLHQERTQSNATQRFVELLDGVRPDA